MSLLHAIQSIVVMALWIYVGPMMLGRWLAKPGLADMNEIAPLQWVQKPAHLWRQIAAYLVLWLGALSCLFIAIAQLLPKDPNASRHHDGAEDVHKHTSGRGIIRVSGDFPARLDLRSERMIPPLSNPDQRRTQRQPHQTTTQLGVITQGEGRDQNRGTNRNKREVPTVRLNQFFDVHLHPLLDQHLNAEFGMDRP